MGDKYRLRERLQHLFQSWQTWRVDIPLGVRVKEDRQFQLSADLVEQHVFRVVHLHAGLVFAEALGPLVGVAFEHCDQRRLAARVARPGIHAAEGNQPVAVRFRFGQHEFRG